MNEKGRTLNINYIVLIKVHTVYSGQDGNFLMVLILARWNIFYVDSHWEWRGSECLMACIGILPCNNSKHNFKKSTNMRSTVCIVQACSRLHWACVGANVERWSI